MSNDHSILISKIILLLVFWVIQSESAQAEEMVMFSATDTRLRTDSTLSYYRSDTGIKTLDQPIPTPASGMDRPSFTVFTSTSTVIRDLRYMARTADTLTIWNGVERLAFPLDQIQILQKDTRRLRFMDRFRNGCRYAFGAGTGLGVIGGLMGYLEYLREGRPGSEPGEIPCEIIMFPFVGAMYGSAVGLYGGLIVGFIVAHERTVTETLDLSLCGPGKL